MERRSTHQVNQAHASQKQEKIVHDYLANKAIGNQNLDYCPSNTPAIKVNSLLNGGMKVLPPIKAVSSSLERVSNGLSTGMNPMPATRHVTTNELQRVEAFKKRDLRGGKRARQTQLSVGKTSLQRNSVLAGSNLKSERKITSIAQGSPSTQDDSIRRTISSKDNNSTGMRSNENLNIESPTNRLAKTQNSALQVIENLEFANPMEEMTRRWQAKVETMLPAIDLYDISQEGNPFQSHKRQFAPEFSQCSYMTMLQEEYAIGDYINLKNSSIKVTEEARHHMVTLLEELNRLKAYKEETFYLACSLADRYLVNVAVQRQKAPCLIRLAIVCTLMSAKLEQPISPSFNRMVRLVEDEWSIRIGKQELISLEEKIIKTLDYELHYTCPIVFLERYQRIFGLDQEYMDEESRLVGDLARRILRTMVGHSAFLRFKTSQMAAAALMLAINVHSSPIAVKLGLPGQLSNLNERSSFFEATATPTEARDSQCPLRQWNQGVRRLTNKCVGRDIKPCYKVMINLVNSVEFEGALSEDSSLFPVASSSKDQHQKAN